MRILATIMIYDLPVRKLSYQYFAEYIYDYFSVELNPINLFSLFFAITI